MHDPYVIFYVVFNLAIIALGIFVTVLSIVALVYGIKALKKYIGDDGVTKNDNPYSS